MDKIIGLGNALVDVLASINNDSELSELNLAKGSMQLIGIDELNVVSNKMEAMNTKCVSGGSAHNTIKALAQLGADASFIGKIGKDKFGEIFTKECKASGVKDSLILCDEPTGVASTFISPDGQRTFATFLGAAAQMKAEEIKADMLDGYTYLYIEGYLVQNHELIRKIAGLAKEKGLKVCLDLASYNIVEADHEFFEELLTEFVDIVFANEEESKAFTGQEPKEALETLSKLCSVAIVKIGKNGAYAQSGNDIAFAPAADVTRVLDTTGAGDCFAAGFLYALSNNLSLEQALKIGSVLSGEVIQVIGASIPDEKWNEIKLKTKEISAC